MNVALHRNELTFFIRHLERWRSVWLRLVPLGVQLRHRVDVVRGLVVIVDLQRLIHFHCRYVRDVLTPLLIIGRRLGSLRPLIAGRDVNDDIFERISRTYADGFSHHWSRVLLGARGFLGLSLIHISEPTRLGMISYAVFCLKTKK